MSYVHRSTYEHYDHEDFENGEILLNTAQYNYVPQQGYLFPGSGLNYVIGIDGHKSLVSQRKLRNPGTFMGTLFCPCFASEEPLSDESKARFKNCLVSFTFLICLAQLSLMAVVLAREGFADVRENPSFGPDVNALVDFGAKSTPLILHDKQIWRFFSSTFLYSGILHALFNLIIHFRLGMFLEREWGLLWYVLTYVVTSVGGTLLSCIAQPHDVGVGATGPIAGMIAAFGVQVLLCYKVFDSFQRKLQACQFLVFFVMMLILLLCPFINWSNAAGGFIFGILMGIIIWAVEEKHLVWILPAILVLVGLGGGFTFLFLFIK